MHIHIHDSRAADDEDRFTAHVALREDVQSVSAVEIDLETYGPSEDAARTRMMVAMRALASKLLEASADAAVVVACPVCKTEWEFDDHDSCPACRLAPQGVN